MISRTFVRAILGAVLVGALLVPSAQADSRARDQQAALDPAIATAIRDHAKLTWQSIPLDPAIQAALLDRASSPARPDDRATHGVGSLPAPREAATSDGFDWNVLGVGAGATFLALLLALGSLLALRHGRARVENA